MHKELVAGPCGHRRTTPHDRKHDGSVLTKLFYTRFHETNDSFNANVARQLH